MTQYKVTWTFTGDFVDEYEACYEAFREMAQIIVRPNRGVVTVQQTDLEDGVTLELLDGLLECDPLFASQILGFRHLIWVQQSYARNRDKKNVE